MRLAKRRKNLFGKTNLDTLISKERPQFWILVSFLALLFLCGGSARPDVISLVFVRPAAVLLTFVGLATLTQQQYRENKYLFWMAIAMLVLAAGHLVPLPPGIWHDLPGRGLIVDIDKALGFREAWRPLTMSPSFGWNALLSLFVPVGVLVVGAQLSAAELQKMMSVFLIGGALSIVLAILQILGPPNGAFYLYRVTNETSAVGLFANRNHQALLLAIMLPMLAVFSVRRRAQKGDDRRRLFIGASLGVVAVVLLLVVGSRFGMGAGLVGLLSIPILYRIGSVEARNPQQARRRFWGATLASALIVSVLMTWAIFADRAEAVRRALEGDGNEDLRYVYWRIVSEHIRDFMPFGSGVGSYERVFQVIEPSSALVPSYSNHAHNDWLEVVFTTGVPGGILLGSAVLMYAVALLKLFRDRRKSQVKVWNWLGLIVIAMIAAESIFDYPARVPIVSALFVIACLWVRLGVTSATEKAAA